MKLLTTPEMRKEVLDLAEKAASHWHSGATGTFAAKELGKYAQDVDTLLEVLRRIEKDLPHEDDEIRAILAEQEEL